MIQTIKKLSVLCSLFIFTFACNDDDGSTNNPSDSANYFPSAVNSQWDYDYTLTSQGQASSGFTTTSIGESSSIDGESYQVMNNTFYLIGAMDQLYFNKSNQEVTIRPAFELMGNQVSLDDMLLLKNNATDGEMISESTVESTGEAFPIPANEYNATGTVTPITYITLKNYHVSNPDQANINGIDYTDLTHQKLTYEIRIVMAIDAEIGFAGTSIPFVENHELVEPQEYGELQIWMAKDIGTVKTNYNYSFEDIEINSTISVAGISIDLLELAPDIGNLTNTVSLSGTALLSDYTIN